MKYVLIYNWKCPDNDWFKKQLINRGHEVVIIDNPDDGQIRYKKWHRAINFLECIMMALKATRMEKDVVIVSMCATPGIIAAIIDRKKHRIIALNLLCHTSEKQTFMEKMRDLIYKKAFSNPNLFSSCNEEGNRNDYIKRFEIEGNNRLIILEDAISAEEIHTKVSQGSYIFSGGASARDWETLIKCANKTPELSYRVCARETDWPRKKISKNIFVDFNVPKEVFDENMMGSKFVLLPLKSDVTAGLLVLFNAINQEKLVICTDTMSIRKFIPKSLHSKLLFKMFDSDELQKRIQWAMGLDEKEYKQIVTELKKYMYENFSTDCYMDKFLCWIKN